MNKMQTSKVETSSRRATYQDVLDAPPHLVAEVVDGTLYTFPRPAMTHAIARSVLGGIINRRLFSSAEGDQAAGGFSMNLNCTLAKISWCLISQVGGVSGFLSFRLVHFVHWLRIGYVKCCLPPHASLIGVASGQSIPVPVFVTTGLSILMHGCWRLMHCAVLSGY